MTQKDKHREVAEMLMNGEKYIGMEGMGVLTVEKLASVLRQLLPSEGGEGEAPALPTYIPVFRRSMFGNKEWMIGVRQQDGSILLAHHYGISVDNQNQCFADCANEQQAKELTDRHARGVKAAAKLGMGRRTSVPGMGVAPTKSAPKTVSKPAKPASGGLDMGSLLSDAINDEVGND